MHYTILLKSLSFRRYFVERRRFKGIGENESRSSFNQRLKRVLTQLGSMWLCQPLEVSRGEAPEASAISGYLGPENSFF